MTQRQGYALARAELIHALTAYTGITTADGAVTRDTLIDANLIGSNDYITEKTILIQSGPANNEDKAAISFIPGSGQINVDSAFSAQIMAGTIFRILNISTVELDVVNILTRIGTNTDPAGTTTLFAWLARIWASLFGSQGLYYEGTVTAAAAPSFTIASLAGLGAGKFSDAQAPYWAFVSRDAGGAGAIPQGQMRVITFYDTATGQFATPAFGAAVAVDDKVMILHPRLAEIANLITWVGYEGATSLANKLTAARAALLDNLDALVSSRAAPGAAMALTAATLLAIQALILTDATPFAGANIALIKTQTDKLAGAAPVAGNTTANWQAAEANVVSIGANDVKNKVHDLTLSIHNLVGTTITVRLYKQVNGVERKCYEQPFNATTDPPGLPIINGTWGIHEVLRCTLQSNNAADNGKAVDYDYMLEAM
jgi:hypothetical protein